MAYMSAQEDKKYTLYKTLGISVQTHAKLVKAKNAYRAQSFDELINLFVDQSIVHIPVPPEALKRWQNAANMAGYPLTLWIAQRVEAALTFGADPKTIMRALTLLTEERSNGEPTSWEQT